jgi:Na+-translocating ferredoxin:NAD+ oxidoreductase RnfG subunit
MAFFKDFITKQLMKKQLKGVPEEQQQKIMALIEQDPDFFKEIGEKIQEEIKKGKGQMEATMSVMKEHREKLAKLMGNSGFTK